MLFHKGLEGLEPKLRVWQVAEELWGFYSKDNQITLDVTLVVVQLSQVGHPTKLTAVGEVQGTASGVVPGFTTQHSAINTRHVVTPLKLE
jgi:hypothetical protein